VPERYLGQSLGRFRIDSLLGSGGFAWVYRGYDPELEIPVAVKVLKPQFAGEEGFESRFRREASTAAKLRHPNIVRILGVGREESAVYFAMDLLPTGLDDRLLTMGTLPEPLLMRLGLDVAAALAFAHREGVIHRDIKTDNILFDAHGNAVVADFGIARAVSGYVEETRTNMVVGTPQYFSPEQARGQTLDGRADLYSLGVTLFKAATGVLPFQGEDWYDVARQHVEEAPPRPGSFNPALSRDVERVILRLLEKNPDDRYPTAEALHAELAHLLGFPETPAFEQTASFSSPSAMPGFAPSTTARRRRRTIARWALSASVVILSGTIFALTAARSHNHVQPDTSTVVEDSVPGSTRLDSLAATAPAVTDTSHPPADTTPTPAATTHVAAPPPPPHRVLKITAPEDAVVRVNGTWVGLGSLRIDTLPAGRYEVAAEMVSVEGCPTARVVEQVRVGTRGTASVTLTPKGCGAVVFDVLPAGAHFVITTVTGDTAKAGTVPTDDQPVVLPAGEYGLHVSQRYCTPFNGPLSIKAGEEQRARARLFCGPAPG
jgi:serine/threonine-protein kinase